MTERARREYAERLRPRYQVAVKREGAAARRRERRHPSGPALVRGQGGLRAGGALPGRRRLPAPRGDRRALPRPAGGGARLRAAPPPGLSPRVPGEREPALRRPRVGSPDVSLLGVAAAEFRKLRRAVKALPGRPSAKDLHAVRIRVKRARYAAELVRATGGRRAERFLDQARKIQDILGEHPDTVVLQGYLHETLDRTEPGHALAQSLMRGQRKRRKKARAAFFEGWPRLERRGRKAWSTRPAP